MTMRNVVNLRKGILGKPDSVEVWEQIIANIPDEVFLNKDVKILNVACGHCTEANVIVKRMLALGRTLSDIKDSIYLLDKYSIFTKDAIRKGYTNVIQADFLEWETDMIFDVVVGNPPYQDGSKEGGQNKIYNQFSKKAIELSTGIVAFVTPASVCKKSKRFSLIGQPGLKLIDFTADDHFDVGIKICSWVVDKSYTGDVTVVSNANTTIQSNDAPFYDSSIVDINFSKLYNAMKIATTKPSSRMFRHNAVDMTIGKGRTKEKTDGFDYPVYTITSDNSIEFVQYNKSQPKLHNKKQLIIPISKSFNEKFATIDCRDFDMKHVSTEIVHEDAVDNIKSFIFSDYFKSHVDQWKKVDGYGWNYAIMYLPKFDNTHLWTNEEVKEFIESHIK